MIGSFNLSVISIIIAIIGVHTPEFAFERDIDNIKHAIARQYITYPVTVDNRYVVWRAFNNQYWPAHYFIDAQGRIRHHHFGEGEYAQSERVIQQLLREAGRSNVASGVIAVDATGAGAAPDFRNVRSPETYLGFQRAGNFISPGGFVRRGSKHYTTDAPRLNEWGLSGQWEVNEEHARLTGSQGGITGGRTLRPQRVSLLLRQCGSIKAKRLFLALAERHQHAWLPPLSLDDVNLGQGKRALVFGGTLHPTWHITLPRDLDEHLA